MTDEDIDRLREIADAVRARAEDSLYGFFPGGDPRDFSPDPESSTDDERASHAEACARWEAGECADVGGPCEWRAEATADDDGRVIVKTLTSHYGLGVYTMRDDEIMRLAQDLDDWIDRARQVLP